MGVMIGVGTSDGVKKFSASSRCGTRATSFGSRIKVSSGLNRSLHISSYITDQFQATDRTYAQSE